ncbi:PPOX class F420-dependent oxidoreductase [Kitasatospora sp. NPDC050543]|uniref:PPOX class F420-dependent oxidoreductase n=1 Tax=Kitasatospora sp. NPDC050543 TaxID=3364054 RepID=UPI0037955A77
MHEDHTEQLAAGRYLLLTTFGEDGTPVRTPIWVVQDGGALGVWTPADSWPARRIRRSPRVLVGPCDARGNPTGGQLPARAALCDPDATAQYRTSLINKYGMPALLTLARSRLRCGLAGTVGIRITLDERAPLLIGAPWQPPGTYSLN